MLKRLACIVPLVACATDPLESEVTADETATWHFSVAVRVPRSLVDEYGLAVYQDVLDQLASVSQRFNAAAAFSGVVSFDMGSFEAFDDTPETEVTRPHPGYAFALVYQETEHPAGGWYGDRQTILHAWCSPGAAANCANTYGVFSETATEGLVHEFGHARGAIDVYDEEVTTNPIGGGTFAPPPGIMTNPYGATTFDAYSAGIIDRSGNVVYAGAPLVDASFPPSFRVQAVDSHGLPVTGVRIQIFPVGWDDRTVSTTAVMSTTTASNSNTWTLPSNPFAPGTANKPWNLAAPNFLVRATRFQIGSRQPVYTAYGWLPLTSVGNAYFADALAPYVLTIHP